MAYVDIDFTNPVGINPATAIPWQVGDPSPPLATYYPDQPALTGLIFAASDNVLQSEIYLDGGLVLQYRAGSPLANWGVFVAKPDNMDLDQLTVIAKFDVFAVREPKKWFVGSVGAVGTSADASSGHLGKPYGIGADQDDLNIGGTMAFNYDADTDKQQTRLNAPGNLLDLDTDSATGTTVKPSFVPHDFFWADLTHPIPLVADVNVLNMQATSLWTPGTPAVATMHLDNAGLSQRIVHARSKKYAGNFEPLLYAGVTLNVGNDESPSPYSSGPLMFRLRSLFVGFLEDWR